MFENKTKVDLISNRKGIIDTIKKNTDSISKTFINRDYKKKFKGKVFESGFQIERIKKGKTAFTPVIFGIMYEYEDIIQLEINLRIKKTSIINMTIGIIFYLFVFFTLFINLSDSNKQDVIFMIAIIIFLFIGTLTFIVYSIRYEKEKSLDLLYEILDEFLFRVPRS